MTCIPHSIICFEKETQYKVETLYEAVKSHGPNFILPLDHTFEAEHMGARLSYNDQNGLYVNEPFNGVHQMDSKRFQVLMTTLKKFNDAHEKVLLNVTGFLTLLSYEFPLTKVFKHYKKKDSCLLESLTFIGDFCHHYLQNAYKNGVRNFYYSDPICDIILVGDSFYQTFIKDSLVKVIEGMNSMKGVTLYLCPKYAKGISPSFFEAYNQEINFKKDICIHQIQNSKKQIMGG